MLCVVDEKMKGQREVEQGYPRKWRLTLLYSRLDVSVHPQHMLRDHPVPLLVRIVRDHKQEIETREERVGEGNVPVWVFVDVVLAVSSPLFSPPLPSAASCPIFAPPSPLPSL